MSITVKVFVGLEFGTDGKPVTEDKVFSNSVDFQSFMTLKKEFNAEDEVLSVKWDCK